VGDCDGRPGRQDVIVIPGRRAKPLRPEPGLTAPAWCDGRQGGNRRHYREAFRASAFERIAYAYADTAKIGDYLKGKATRRSPASAPARKR